MQQLQRTSDYDIISLHNIDDEDFIFEYDRAAGNPPYVIPANTVKRYPRFLANHALKHLIDKILTKKDKKTNNEVARQDLAAQIVINEETFQSPVEKSEVEKNRELVESMNKPSDLEQILQKQKAKAPSVPPGVVPSTALPEDKDEEEFEGLEKSEQEEVKPVPTRKEIYAYAQNTLKMVLDEKTTKNLDKMKIEDLLKEVGDPREALVK